MAEWSRMDCIVDPELFVKPASVSDGKNVQCPFDKDTWKLLKKLNVKGDTRMR